MYEVYQFIAVFLVIILAFLAISAIVSLVAAILTLKKTPLSYWYLFLPNTLIFNIFANGNKQYTYIYFAIGVSNLVFSLTIGQLLPSFISWLPSLAFLVGTLVMRGFCVAKVADHLNIKKGAIVTISVLFSPIYYFGFSSKKFDETNFNKATGTDLIMPLILDIAGIISLVLVLGVVYFTMALSLVG